MNAFTPAKSFLSWAMPPTPSVPANQMPVGKTTDASVGSKRGQTGISGFKAPSTAGRTGSASRKRKLDRDGIELNASDSNLFEMQEFSTVYGDLVASSPFSIHGGDFIDYASNPSSGTQSARNGAQSVGRVASGVTTTALCTPLRRSPRVAMRRSLQQQRSSQFPALSILSPVSLFSSMTRE